MDNAYGDANSQDHCNPNEKRRTKKPPLSNQHDHLSSLISAQSKELLEVVENLRKEKDAIIKEKDEEIQNLKDELKLMKKKVAQLSEGRAENGAASADLFSKMEERPKTPRFLGMERGDSLYTFIDKKLRPNKQFNTQCNQIINALVRKIQAKESPFNVKRIVKSGSLGKGTHVKNRSDIDLIIFFNGFKTVQELETGKPELLKGLKEYIQKDWSDQLLYKDQTPNSVQFWLKMDERDNDVEVDLLPALDLTQSGRALSDIYTEMKALPHKDRAPYAQCFSPLQVEFVSTTNRVSTPGKVKDLIRLLKNWAKDEDVSVRSYFLELLVVDLWRKNGTPSDINLEQYLQDVLQTLADCRDLQLTFTDHYQYTDYRPGLKKPFLLDPANPFRNVAPVSEREIANVIHKVDILRQRTV